MYKFVYQLNEIRKIFIQFKFIETALDFIIILLSSFLIFQYFGIKPGWIISVPIAIYLVIALKNKFNYNLIKLIEKHYPALRERLSTAYDNKEEKNVVMEDLTSTILTDMEQVRYSSFISTRFLGIRIVIILLLVTMVLFTAIINFPITGQIPSEGKHAESKINIFSSGISGSGTDMDIFNEPTYVRIGNESEGLIVYSGSGSELNVPGERKQVPEYSKLFPQEEALASSSQIYAEAIPIIYHQIVKNYFTNLSGE